MADPERAGVNLPIALFAAVALIALGGALTGADAGGAITTDVISSGGQVGVSSSFRLDDTFGQGPIGPVASGATVTLQDGFWATLGAKATEPGDTLAPGPVVNLEAFPGDTLVGLAWTNPSDPDFAYVLIRFSTNAAPTSPDDGAPVPNGNSGQFWNLPGVGDDWVHLGLANGTTYFYTAFAFDSSYNHSAGVSISAVPLDTVPPAPVATFAATAGDTTVTLEWMNAPDSDLDHVLIRFSTSGFPTTPSSGNAVPNGSNGEFPLGQNSFIHTHLANGSTYYYSIFAADEVPNYSVRREASATPHDATPPGPVKSFTVASGERSDTLTWQNPDDSDLKEVMIRYSVTGWVGVPTGGSPVENGNDGIFSGMVPGATNNFVHQNLTPKVTYYYSIFTFDTSNNNGSYTFKSGTPFDHTPPELSVSVFQNPYVTNHLDIYMVPSEAVSDTSVHISVGTTELDRLNVDPAKNIWKSDYDLCYACVLSLRACAEDLYGNGKCVTRTFSAALLTKTAGGTARSADGRFEVSLLEGVLSQDVYVLVFESDGVYELSPPGLPIGGYAEISIAYGDGEVEPEHLWIAQFDGAASKPVDCYVDRDAHRLVAYVTNLSSYGLVERPDGATPNYGEGELRIIQNVPNPFAASTSIVFEAARAGEVTIEILSVDGRLVRAYPDQFVVPGRNLASWDGCDDGGRRVAGGLYLCRISLGAERVTHKMVYVH